jgi:hypothetical protein
MSFANVLDANQKINTQFLPPEALGGVTQVVASTGITVGGTPTVPVISNAGVVSLSGKTGAAALTGGAGILITPDINPLVQGIDIANSGVLALNGEAGVLTTKVGQYYLSANQNLTSGSTDIIFDTAQSWTDLTAISWTGPSADFTVAIKGLYQLEFAAFIQLNGGSWVATNKTASIDITRSPNPEIAVIAQSAQMAVGGYNQTVNATYALEVGDVINLRIINIFSGGPLQAVGISNAFDLNTFFTWSLIKPLPP